MSAGSRAERTHTTWITVAVLVGVVLRLARPDVHSLWIDEGMTVRIALAEHPFEALRADSHPPLVFLLFRIWIRAFGESDTVLRILPALVSCASLCAFVPLARAWLGRERAAWAIALHAVAPLCIWFAHEVRMYAFLECGTLLVLLLARRVWAAPGFGRWCALAAATALATGLHYYGALAGLVVVAQAVRRGRRPAFHTSLAAGLGVLAWTPWLLAFLPAQRSGAWPVIVQTSARDFAEIPARLLAVDFVELTEPHLEFVGYGLGALALGGTLLALFQAVLTRIRRARSSVLDEVPRPDADALLAFVVPIAAAWILATFAGGGFQPRYLTPAIPGCVAVVVGGLFVLRPAWLARAACAAAIVCCATMVVLQLRQNRREDYRSACAEIREQWRDGDRLLLLVCVPASHSGATVDHYLRDRPDILAAQIDMDAYLSGASRPPAGTRLHVVWREATVCWEPMHELESSHAILERSAGRFRIHRLLTTVP